MKNERPHVLILVDQLFHDNRIRTGLARVVLETVRSLSSEFYFTILASTEEEARRLPLGESVELVRCADDRHAQRDTAVEIAGERSVDMILCCLDQSLIAAASIKDSLPNDPPLMFWLHIEPVSVGMLDGLTATQSSLARVLTVTDYQRRALLAIFPQLAGRCHVSTVGIRCPDVESAEMPLDLAKRTLLYVGRRTADKGYDLWLNIAEELASRRDDVEFVTVGMDSPFAPKIAVTRRYRLLAGGLLRETSYLSPTSLAQLMRNCDLLVHPTRTDCVPICILEAWHLGLPVLGAPADCLRELDAGEGAIEFPRIYSSRAFADAAEHLLDNAGTSERVRSKGSALVAKEHTDTAMGKALSTHFSSLLGAKR